MLVADCNSTTELDGEMADFLWGVSGVLRKIDFGLSGESSIPAELLGDTSKPTEGRQSSSEL